MIEITPEKLKDKVMEIFERYDWREDIERELRNLGFDEWVEIDGYGDEAIWAYDKGTPNRHILVLINWIDGFAWIFRKEEKVNVGGR